MNFRRLRRFNKGVVNVNDIGIGEEASGTIRDGQNIRVRSGDIVARAGIADYMDFDLAVGIMGNEIQALYEYQKEEWDSPNPGDTTIFRTLVFTVNSRLYYADPDYSTTEAVLISAVTSTNIYCVNIYDHMFIAGTRDGLKVTDINNYFNAGIAKPSDISSINAVVGSPGYTGIKRYKYTWYRSADPYNKESEASDYFQGPSCAAQDAEVTYTQATDPQVTHYRIYATETGGSVYYLLDTVSLAAAVAASHIYTDDDVTPTTSAMDTTQRKAPGDYYIILWHDNRLYGVTRADPSVIQYSDIGKPWYFSDNGYDEIGRDDGDVLSALGAIGATRYMFKTRSIYEWTGDPSSITPIRAIAKPDSTINDNAAQVGCADPRSLASWKGDALIFRAEDGHVYKLTQSSLTKLSQYYRDVVDMPSGSVGAIFDDYYILSHPASPPDGVGSYVCDLRNNAWQGKDEIGSVNCFLIDHNGYLLGGREDHIRRYYTGTQDEGEDFTKIAKSRYLEVSDGDKAGVLRRVVAEHSSRDCDFTASVFNEKEQIATGTYSSTAKHYSLPDSSRGKQADYASVQFSWTGTAVILGARMFFKMRRRH